MTVCLWATDEAFADFWKTYPRRQGKGAARKAWERAVSSVGVDVVLDGARRFAEDPNLPHEQRFIPHPTTWLNQERWGDDALPTRGKREQSVGLYEEALRIIEKGPVL